MPPAPASAPGFDSQGGFDGAARDDRLRRRLGSPAPSCARAGRVRRVLLILIVLLGGGDRWARSWRQLVDAEADRARRSRRRRSRRPRRRPTASRRRPRKQMIEKTATRVLDGARRSSGSRAAGRLVVVKGPDRGETIAIADAGAHASARAAAATCCSPTRPSRASTSASSPVRQGVVLRDLGSTNGSFVQGSRFNELTLGFGTEVTIGKTVLKFVPDEEAVDLAPSDAGELRLAGRSRPEAAAAVPRARRRRRHRRDGADRGRDRHRQGAARRGDPPPQPAQGRPVRRVRLRRGPRRADRIGAVRPRARRVHRRDHRSPRRVRGGRRRHAVPRRDRRAAARRAAGAAARARQAARCARSAASTYTRSVGARRRGHQPRPARRGRRAGVSARTSTTASRSCAWRCRRCASAPTTSRCWSQHFVRQFRGDRAARRSRARTSTGCGGTTGRATCASCAT